MTNVEALKKGAAYWNKWITEQPPSDTHLDFRHADLRGLDLYDLEARAKSEYYIVHLQHADFTGCNLEEAKFELTDLKDANFTNANLHNATFRKANCTRAIFRGADLTHSRFHRAIVDEADFTGADMQQAEFDISSARSINVDQAKIKNIILAPVSPELNVLLHISGFELLRANNLERVHTDSREFLIDFVQRSFEQLHAGPLEYTVQYRTERGIEEHKSTMELAEKWNPEHFQDLLNRVTALHHYYRTPELSQEIVTLSNTISLELINYLRTHPKMLHQIHWRVFEELVAEILHSFGWTVEITSPTKDGGYDIFGIYKDQSGIRHHWLIECKKWGEENLVGVDVIRALYGVKTDMRVGNALLATTSHFTKGVQEFKASHYDLETVDFEGITGWLKQYNTRSDGGLWLSNKD